MDFSVCAQCGVDIENMGIHYRNRVFCSDECCEDFEADFANKNGPVIDELIDDSLVPEELVDDLDFSEDGLEEDLDDEFDLKLGDF